MGKGTFLLRWKFLWDGKNISELHFPSRLERPGKVFGAPGGFFLSFYEALHQSLPSHRHSRAVTESFTLLEGKNFIFLVCPRVLYFFKQQTPKISIITGRTLCPFSCPGNHHTRV